MVANPMSGVPRPFGLPVKLRPLKISSDREETGFHRVARKDFQHPRRNLFMRPVVET